MEVKRSTIRLIRSNRRQIIAVVIERIFDEVMNEKIRFHEFGEIVKWIQSAL